MSQCFSAPILHNDFLLFRAVEEGRGRGGQKHLVQCLEDEMHITHRQIHLDIERWRECHLRLCDKVEKEIEAICHSQDFGLSIPDCVLNDWADMSQWYSWTKNGTFLDDEHCLIRFLLFDQSSNLAVTHLLGDHKEGGFRDTFVDRWANVMSAAHFEGKYKEYGKTSPDIPASTSVSASTNSDDPPAVQPRQRNSILREKWSEWEIWSI